MASTEALIQRSDPSRSGQKQCPTRSMPFDPGSRCRPSRPAQHLSCPNNTLSSPDRSPQRPTQTEQQLQWLRVQVVHDIRLRKLISSVCLDDIISAIANLRTKEIEPAASGVRLLLSLHQREFRAATEEKIANTLRQPDDLQKFKWKSSP
ncbi:hypothetical protein ACLOJK_004450 [Asimina triloba]